MSRKLHQSQCIGSGTVPDLLIDMPKTVSVLTEIPWAPDFVARLRINFQCSSNAFGYIKTCLKEQECLPRVGKPVFGPSFASLSAPFPRCFFKSEDPQAYISQESILMRAGRLL